MTVAWRDIKFSQPNTRPLDGHGRPSLFLLGALGIALFATFWTEDGSTLRLRYLSDVFDRVLRSFQDTVGVASFSCHRHAQIPSQLGGFSQVPP